MPRLRKSLRGLHPKDLHGNIWPQKKEVPITTFKLLNKGRPKKKFDNDGALVDSQTQYDFNGKAVKVWKRHQTSSQGSSEEDPTRVDEEMVSPLRNDLLRGQLGISLGSQVVEAKDQANDGQTGIQIYPAHRTKVAFTFNQQGFSEMS